MDGLADCDLVIESAVEKEEVKRKIFHDLCAVLKPEAHRRLQYLLDLDHAACRFHRPARSASSAFTS